MDFTAENLDLTLDEIEAQMSMQWWKSKHGDGAARERAVSSTNFPMSTSPGEPLVQPAVTVNSPLPPVSASYVTTARQDLESEPRSPRSAPAGAARPMLDYGSLAPRPESAPTEPLPLEMRQSLRMPQSPPSPPPSTTPDPSGFSNFNLSKVLAIDVEEFAHDPELEEAAIRFANGDVTGAEAGLALFDLYRAVGQQERFETAALEFARRMGRSAPQWVSLPQQVAGMGSAQASPGGPTDRVDWACPGSLGVQSVAQLAAVLKHAPQPWQLAWSMLRSIEPAAVEPLTRLAQAWAGQPVQIRFMGAEVLERVLRELTRSGDRAVSAACWKLRMELLRVMHRPDEFELVALDYCVTYEVSPPSWERSLCDYKSLQADGSAVAGHTIVGDAMFDSVVGTTASVAGDLFGGTPSSQMAHVGTVELAGQILGDAQPATDLLDSRLKGADMLVISCARLIRIDFTAAGGLLNWVSQRQSEGRQVQFVDVHRLVAALFNVIGISAHARVGARRD